MTSNGSGRLEAIFRKRMRRGPMDSLESGELVPGDGLVGNADLRTKRQVTLIEAELWQRVRDELGVPDLDPRLRRANLLVRGVPLAQSRGRVLRVGPARLLIHGETRPCTLMEDGHTGLQAALDPEWRGGVYAEVLEGGPIAVGDPVGWE
jgi:MOSC domain-containing protein YiiM